MKKILLTATAVCLTAISAHADMFTLHLQQTSTGLNETRGFESIIDLFDKYEDGSLDSIIAGYDKNAAADGLVNFRGIPMELSFDGSGNLMVVPKKTALNC